MLCGLSIEATLISVEREACDCCIASFCFALRIGRGLSRDALVCHSFVEIRSTAFQGSCKVPGPNCLTVAQFWALSKRWKADLVAESSDYCFGKVASYLLHKTYCHLLFVLLHHALHLLAIVTRSRAPQALVLSFAVTGVHLYHDHCSFLSIQRLSLVPPHL